MLSRQAITFYGDIKQGVDDDGLSLNFLPDGGRCLHKLFLKNSHIRIPEYLKGQFRTHGNTLGAADALFQIIVGIIGFRDRGCICRTDIDANAATGAFLLYSEQDDNRHAFAVSARGRQIPWKYS